MQIKTNPVKLGSVGYYSLHVSDAFGSEVVSKRVDRTENVVTYSGAFSIFFEQSMFGDAYISVGTGTSEITRSQNSLGTQINTMRTYTTEPDRSDANEVDNGNGTSTLTLLRSTSFPVGDVVGTISEVGLNKNSNSISLIAGQLIKDEFGAPTTVTVLSDEQLTVTYTLELTVPNGVVDVSPIIGSGTLTSPRGDHTYNIYAQPFFMDFNTNSISSYSRYRASYPRFLYADSTGINAGTFSSRGTSSFSGQGTGTITLTLDEITASPSSFASADIKYIMAFEAWGSGSSSWQIDTTKKLNASSEDSGNIVLVEVTPPLEKTSQESLTMGMTFEFSI